MNDRAGLWPGLIALAILVLFLALFAGFVPDDLYIYLQFARNMVERGEVAFNAGEPVNAVTSPLWFLLLAGVRAVGLDPLAAAKVLSAAAALAALLGVMTLTRWATGSGAAAGFAGLLAAADPWLLRWGASGMEASASAAAVAWAFALRVRALESGPPEHARNVHEPPSRERAGRGVRGAALGSALLLALTPLLRPECALLVAVVIVWDLGEALRGRGVRLVLREVGAAALLPGAWFAFAISVFGSAVPATAVAKGSLGSVFFQSGEALARTLVVVVTSQAPALIFLAAATVCWWRRGRPPLEARRIWGPAAVWGTGLVALYTLRHVNVYTRYLLTLTPLVAAAGGAAAASLLRVGPVGRRVVHAVAGAGIAASLLAAAFVILPATRGYAADMETVSLVLARDLRERAPEGAAVAVANIGAIGYVSGRRVVDLNGLVTPEIVPFKREGRLDEYLSAHPPDYFIDIHEDPRHALVEPPGLALRPIRSLPFRHMFLRQKRPLWYSLYEVDGPLPAGNR